MSTPGSEIKTAVKTFVVKQRTWVMTHLLALGVGGVGGFLLKLVL